MRESTIEKKLCLKVKKLGGMCEKFTSPGRRSVPDRIVSLPGGKIFFIEVKAPGRKPTLLQKRDHERRKALGQKVFVISSLEEIDAFFS